MKEKTNLPEPTKSELEILEVLWDKGASTVRFVNDELNKNKREVHYTSTLKLMQIMAEKGLVKRDETKMTHVYSPVAEEAKTKSGMLDRFLGTTYKGSASQLMMQLLDNKNIPRKELEAIKDMVRNLDKKNKL